MANSSLDSSDRAVLEPLARLLSAVYRAAGETPILLVGAAVRDPRRSLESLDTILRAEIDPDGALRLVAQMPPGDRDRQLSLLAAFCAGLFETSLSGT